LIQNTRPGREEKRSWPRNPRNNTEKISVLKGLQIPHSLRSAIRYHGLRGYSRCGFCNNLFPCHSVDSVATMGSAPHTSLLTPDRRHP
jgi:hypothetical protein